MPKTEVRVYLDKAIMAHPKFAAVKNDKQYFSYYFANLPIVFNNGRFYINTYDGVLPDIFENMGCEFSIKYLRVEGDIPVGRYRDERFPSAEALVSHGDLSKHDVHVEGTVLGDVLSLYHAIVAGEVLPVTVGKTPIQVINELLQELRRTKNCLSITENMLKLVQSEIQSIETLCDIALNFPFPWKFKEARNYASLIKNMEALSSSLRQNKLTNPLERRVISAFEHFCHEIKWAYRPWYMKLETWIYCLK